MSRRRQSQLGLGGPAPVDDPRPKAPNPFKPVLAAVVIGAAVVTWLLYDPLEQGQPTECPPGSEHVPAERFDEPDVEQFGDRGALCLVRNVDTTETAVTAIVRNTGMIPAHVTGMRVAGVHRVFDVDTVGAAPADAPMDVDRAEPLDGSVRIEPDTERLLVVRLSMEPCETVTQGRVATLSDLQLRARVAGLPRDVDIRLDPVLRLQSEVCPP